MSNLLKKVPDSVFLFFEKKFITIFMGVFIFLIAVLKIGLYFPKVNSLGFIIGLDHFIQNDVTNAFISRDSTLITLAAVFIGIYFTAYTLLATLSSKSTFSVLNKNHLSSLINYIKNAFLASFSYLILSLLSPLLHDYNWFYAVISLLLLVYMLLSALRFGLLIYLILKRDVDNFLDRIEKENKEEIKNQRILNDLEKFLQENKEKQGKKSADEISELIKKRKENRDKE
ncbi:hypothetical protein [Halobacillus massiliensis]|uniref:hypothetical protein n=1 Tax=Halobacillus massiliensis TaxID=1926286 RepID=UPI0009E43049|nr:hypothetical protein [Halobacillus massiliensis]